MRGKEAYRLADGVLLGDGTASPPLVDGGGDREALGVLHHDLGVCGNGEGARCENGNGHRAPHRRRHHLVQSARSAEDASQVQGRFLGIPVQGGRTAAGKVWAILTFFWSGNPREVPSRKGRCVATPFKNSFSFPILRSWSHR